MEFKERLKKYRESLNLNKREFSKKLDIHENSYYMIESGTRKPSKKFLAQLVLYSKKPEEFWLYGAQTNIEICNTREEYKMLHCVMDEIKKEYINTSKLNENQKKLILLAFESDLKNIIEKEKSK